MEKNELDNELNNLEKSGFQIALNQLLKDMCRQFPNKKFFIKEYVVNSADANAKRIVITATRKNEFITVIITDDGNGMTKSEVIGFFGVFKSNKTNDKKTAGQFGIGKLSIGAIPNQTELVMITSTGKECWHAKTGSILNNEPIQITRLKKVKQKGTRFKITYKLETSLKNELEVLKNILSSSVSFLSPEIIVLMPASDEEGKLYPVLINQVWPGNDVHHHKTFRERIGGEWYTITLGFGRNFHGIYQNRIFITDTYNLLGPDTEKSVSKLTIMVDSSGFELPFGRHKIQNTEELDVISTRVLRRLPDFYREVFGLFRRGNLFTTKYDFDLFVSDLIYHFNDAHQPWNATPVFKGVNENVYSYAELQASIRNGQSIFIADPTMAGVDFSKYNGPVLSNEQNGRCSQIIKEHFMDKYYDLNVNDFVMEEFGEDAYVHLSEREKKFQKHLGFQRRHFGSNRLLRNRRRSNKILNMVTAELPGSNAKNVEKELDNANLQLQNIKWRVSRLVEKDYSPCKSRLYLFQKNTIILNLYHTKIAELVALSDFNPALAAHFANALALLDKQSVLPDVNPETRESLLLVDAMSRVNGIEDDFYDESLDFWNYDDLY